MSRPTLVILCFDLSVQQLTDLTRSKPTANAVLERVLTAHGLLPTHQQTIDDTVRYCITCTTPDWSLATILALFSRAGYHASFHSGEMQIV